VLLDAHPLVRLRLLSESLLRTITERQDHVQVFLHEYRALQGDLLDRFRSRRRDYEAHVTTVFTDGVSMGAFVLDDLRLTTLAFLGMHNSTYQWIQADGRLDARTISATYCRIFFDGVLSNGLTVASVDADVDRFRPNIFG